MNSLLLTIAVNFLPNFFFKYEMLDFSISSYEFPVIFSLKIHLKYCFLSICTFRTKLRRVKILHYIYSTAHLVPRFVVSIVSTKILTTKSIHILKRYKKISIGYYLNRCAEYFEIMIIISAKSIKIITEKLCINSNQLRETGKSESILYSKKPKMKT